ncbi:MAG: glutathione synthase [Burkholderiaceae bacterium]|nr:glutathione synthase [Burkholderiaceae bacterium]
MKIAFACDPLSGFNLKKDSTYAMMREAFKRGHELYAFQHADIMIHEGRVSATASHIVLTGDTGAWYRVEQTEQQSLSLFDVVVERTDPPFDMEYVYATHLLELAVTQGARVWNHPAAIRNHNEKLAITGFTQFTAPTLVSCDPSHVRAFHAEHRDIILKPLDGMGGMGVFRVRDDAMNLGAIIETLTDNGRRTIMAQRYIPEIIHGDKRVLLIDGAVVPYCLARVPQAGEVRGNLAAGGTGIAMPLSERERAIAETLAPVLRARGLMLVGLDIIGQYLTEINVTSPTCFQEIMQQTACDVAALFVDALERATH